MWDKMDVCTEGGQSEIAKTPPEWGVSETVGKNWSWLILLNIILDRVNLQKPRYYAKYQLKKNRLDTKCAGIAPCRLIKS